jgi:DNA-binding transcriptional regulator YiaG
MHNDAMPTSEEIKAIREKLGETQAAFAERFGVDQATVHRWETRGLPTRTLTQRAIKAVLAQLEGAE